MNKFYVITNRLKDPELITTKYIRDYLEGKGKSCAIQECTPGHDVHNYKYTNAELVPKDIDCVLVLGGDGTLLQASRDLVGLNIPLLGINLGTLGYLAEIDKQNITPALDKLLMDDYVVRERMMLFGTAYHQNKMLMKDIALNDIVIGRNGRLRIIDLNIYVNDEFLNSYSADGIIISTPTGSTGYSLSAGGPIVSPEAEVIMITPIAPHTLNTRSIVLPANVKVTVEIGEGHNTREGVEATFDGDTSVNLICNDKIVICKSERSTSLVKINNISFLEILRKKMTQA